MRRLLTLLLLLVIGAIVGAPYVVGMQMEGLYADYMKKTIAPGALELQSTKFSRGWFKSTAHDTFTVSGPGCEAAGCKTLVVDTVIHHGPLAITGLMDGTAPLRPVRGVIISNIDLSPLMPEGGIDPALPPLKCSTVVELDGSATSRLSMQPSQHTVKGKDGTAKLALGGIDGRFTAGADTSHVQGTLDFASLNLESESGKTLELKGAGIDLDGSVEDSSFLGKLTERVERIAAKDPNGQPFELQGLSFVLDSKPDGNVFDIGFKSTSTLGRAYGPVRISGAVTGLNRAALKAMQKDLQAIQAQNKPPLEAMAANMQVYQAHLPDLLKTNPELDVKTISIATSDGEILGGLLLASGTPGSTAEPAGMLQMLKVNFRLQIPAVTLWNIIDAQKQEAGQKAAALTGATYVMPTQEQIGAEITKLVQANMLLPKLDANAYTVEGSLENGRVTLNGQELGDWNTAMGALMAPPPVAALPTPPEPAHRPAPKKRRR